MQGLGKDKRMSAFWQGLALNSALRAQSIYQLTFHLLLYDINTDFISLVAKFSIMDEIVDELLLLISIEAIYTACRKMSRF